VPIFVAGTGRSGTTQLSQILGQHPDVSTLAHETRFLIDPGGLEDLVRALTCAYTPFHASDALGRLETLLTRRLTGREDSAFAWWNMPEEVGPERYHDWTRRFLGELRWYEFDEVIARPGGGQPIRNCLRVGRYFADRGELIALCRRYVDELFCAVARDRGKRIWCEKTPFNMLSMAFLWELFPEANVVHIMRHPMAVVASHLDMPWAPSDVAGVCNWLSPAYQRWLAFRESYPLDDRYVEVKLEELAVDWPASRAALFQRLGLPDAETPSRLDANRIVHHGRQLSDSERTEVRRRLGFAISALGYGG
jgi:omega-hydroxy-beta-dihydromenaquinone-9 sulfotransferase